MLLYVGIGGYVLLFAIVSGLFRYEYQMPTLLCFGFAVAVVAFGLVGSAAVSLSGLAPLSQTSGASAIALLLSMIGLVLVGEDTASA